MFKKLFAFVLIVSLSSLFTVQAAAADEKPTKIENIQRIKIESYSTELTNVTLILGKDADGVTRVRSFRFIDSKIMILDDVPNTGRPWVEYWGRGSHYDVIKIHVRSLDDIK
jgi:hypothetical protein